MSSARARGNREPAEDTPGGSGPVEHRRVEWRRLVERRLIFRVTIPFLIGLVLLVLALVDLSQGHAPARVLLWLLPGFAVGYGFGRMTGVAWDSEASQVVQDGSGTVLLIAYLIVRFGEAYLLSPRFFDWPYVSNAAALVGVGLMLGKGIGTRKKTMRALRGPIDNLVLWDS